MIVVDASVLAPALGDDGVDGDLARSSLGSGPLFAPELIDLEVASVWRRASRGGRLEGRRAEHALADLASFPLVRAPHAPLLDRIWELRENATPYDAAYIALAEALRAPLLTADARLADTPGARCKFEVVNPAGPHPA
jgi:predicted nucleic acid-binding protein